MNCQRNNHGSLPEHPSLLTIEGLPCTVSGIKFGCTESETNASSFPSGTVLGNRCRESRQCILPNRLFDVLDEATLSVFVYCVLTVTLLVFPQMFGHPVISTSSTTYVWMLSTKQKEGLDTSWKETAIKKTQAHIHTHTHTHTPQNCL